jgi:hypothetical protein
MSHEEEGGGGFGKYEKVNKSFTLHTWGGRGEEK